MNEMDMFGNPIVEKPKDKLSEKFFYPPFSVLNAREGWWQTRKAAWLALGIKSELGRGAQLIGNGGGNGSKQRYDGAERERERVASFKNQAALTAFRRAALRDQPVIIQNVSAGKEMAGQ